MAPSTQSRSQQPSSSRRKHNNHPNRQKVYAFPYFAHQELDHVKYGQTQALALPVGKPGWAPAPVEIATAANGGWDDEVDFPSDDDLGDDISLKSAGKPSTSNSNQGIPSTKNPYKRLRVSGGRPAVAKKVTADLDSDDELIVRMKNAKYLEKDIAKRLADEGRTAYNPKTIGTRWARLRKVLAIRNDELLDAEMTDWHDGDDDALYQAYHRAHEITEKAKIDAEARRWRVVADELKHIKPVTNFSQNACRSRYESLQTGTAKPTPESVVDPDEETLVRIQSRREKEARIKADIAAMGVTDGVDNIKGNAWTSKSRKYV